MQISLWKQAVLANSPCGGKDCYKERCIKVIHGEYSPWVSFYLFVGEQWLFKNLKGEALASYVAEKMQGTIKIEKESYEAYKKS